MTTDVDSYIDLIRLNDKGSRFAAARCAPTLRNSAHVQVLHGATQDLPVLKIPDGYDVIVHSASGSPEEHDRAAHAKTLVDKLCAQAQRIGATPVGFANVIDSKTGDLSMLEAIFGGLVEASSIHGLAILNGENAILGDRVADVNVSGTMISMLARENSVCRDQKVFEKDGIWYARFDPQGRLVFINADDVGTKTEFYERLGKPEGAVNDCLAMNLDDAIKLGATARVVSGVVETRGALDMQSMRHRARVLGMNLNIAVILEHEEVGDRIASFRSKSPPPFIYNVNGAVVSTIDEQYLQRPLRPQAGEHLIAIRGEPNPRSNGITDKRKMMQRLFGEDWHMKREGKLFLEYLAQPSTILYGLFRHLVDEGLATSVYHMSGGAFNGKLARPLAQHGLFVHLHNLFDPDWRELTLAGAAFTSAEQAYAKWPMGNDGFVTTSRPKATMYAIASLGLNARLVGQLEQSVDGKTGVELEALPGKTVYFSGRE